MKKYRGGVIGLGWMGMLYDLAKRIGDKFEIDDADRPTPELDVHKKIHHHEHPGIESNPTSYAEAIYDMWNWLQLQIETLKDLMHLLSATG